MMAAARRSPASSPALSSSNLIENLFSHVYEVARRVKHWQGGMMILS
jgi:hypothetical protein